MNVLRRTVRFCMRCTPLQVLLIVLVGSGIQIPEARGDEFSTISTSTVLGRNYGIPTGTSVPFELGLNPEAVSGQVDFVVESAFYFKNMELFGLDDVAEGETLFGVLLPLRFRYRVDSRFQFELGALVGEDYGDGSRANVAEPLIRATFVATEKVYVVAGSLYSTHWIHDALVDDTNKLRGRGEQGVQLRVDRKRLKQDLWINWRVRETGVRAEEFEIASSNQARFFDESVHVDAHAIWSHAGGQISSSDRLEHNLVFLLGGSVGTPGAGVDGWLEEARLGGRYLYSIESGRGIERDTGSGWEVAGSVTIPVTSKIKGRIHASHFRGHGLFNQRGDPLYALDNYTQLGGSLVFSPLRDLGIETGILGQLTDDELNFTYTVNFVWGHGFRTPLAATDD